MGGSNVEQLAKSAPSHSIRTRSFFIAMMSESIKIYSWVIFSED